MINTINKIYFDKFKSAIFDKFKAQTAIQELEEIKIYNIKPKEGTVDVIILKEKYVSNLFYYY